MAKIGNLMLDVVTEETTDMSNQVTGRPVEKGISICDHISQDPVRLDLSVVISGDVYKDTYGDLVKMRNAQETFDYISAGQLDSFKNMAIEKISVSSSPTITNGFVVKLSLKQVRLVEQATTVTPGKDPITGTQATVDNTQVTKLAPVTETVDPSSVSETFLQKTGNGSLAESSGSGEKINLQTIPVDATQFEYTGEKFSLNLNQDEFIFDMTWNSEAGAFFTDLYGKDGSSILSGRKLIHGENLFENVLDDRLAGLKIIPLDKTGMAAQTGINLSNFCSSVKLYLLGEGTG